MLLRQEMMEPGFEHRNGGGGRFKDTGDTYASGKEHT